MFFGDSKILNVLSNLGQTLKWLVDSEPIVTDNIPEEHVDALKQLEKMGVVNKRNGRVYELKRQRLKRLLAHESRSLPQTVELEDIIAASMTVEPAPQSSVVTG